MASAATIVRVAMAPRRISANGLIQRHLSAAKCTPAQLEPTGVCRSDGKCPDGASIVPWGCGQVLVWDVTCPDTFVLHAVLD